MEDVAHETRARVSMRNHGGLRCGNSNSPACATNTTHVSVKHVQEGVCTGRTFKSRESRLGGNILPMPGSGIITPRMESEGA